MSVDYDIERVRDELEAWAAGTPAHLIDQSGALLALDRLQGRLAACEGALERFIEAYFAGPDYDEPMDGAAGEAMEVMGTSFSLGPESRP